MRDPKRSMCAAILSLQAIVLGLTAPVLISVTDVSVGLGLGVGLGLALLCIVTAGMLRRPWAYGVGWGIQVASIGLGVLITPMIALGVIFGSLWAGAVALGNRIERDRAAWAAAEGDPPDDSAGAAVG